MIAIDPGAAGGLAYYEDGEMKAVPMPEGMTAQIDLIRSLAAEGHKDCVMENVGFHMPGNSATATAKFARPCGEIKGESFTIKTKCWRTGDHPSGCAVYVEGDIMPTDKLLIATHVASSTGWLGCDWYLYIDGELFGKMATEDEEDDNE